VIADSRRIAPGALLARVNGGNLGGALPLRGAAGARRTGGCGYRTCWTVHGAKRERGCGPTGSPVRTRARGTGGGVCAWRVLGRGRVFFAEVEVGEVGLRSVGGESDGGLERLVERERVAVKRREPGGEHRAETFPDDSSEGFRPPGGASASLRAIRSVPRVAGEAVGVEHEGGGPLAGGLRDAAGWVWVLERPVGFGVVDCVPGDGFGGGAPSAPAG